MGRVYGTFVRQGLRSSYEHPGSRDPLFDAQSPIESLESLSVVLNTVRELSRESDADVAAREYADRLKRLIPTDRSLSLSRRDLAFPSFRITRSGLWTSPVNPWRDRARLPVLSGGLLAELIYADEPRIMDDLEISDDDPAIEHLQGHRSLLAIPHFDHGQGLNMVIHLRKERGGFDHAHLPQAVLMSNLFGRAINGLVLSNQLSEANAALKEQFTHVSNMSDTVLDQALRLKRHTRVLEATVKERTRELREAHLNTIYMLAVASEAKDEDTGGHVRRIQKYSELLAREMGGSADEAEALGYAAILHDVGKMHVPDQILKKPGRLTDSEREVMQQHAVMGEHILSDTPFFSLARKIARGHHENWDGSGYPDKLSREQIPPEVRIVHLADVYDALVSPRVYKKAWSVDRAVHEITSLAGTMFDPVVVQAFVRGVRDGSFVPVGAKAI